MSNAGTDMLSVDDIDSGSSDENLLAVRPDSPKKTHRNRIVYTRGRPPWYDSHGHAGNAFIIGLCGGSASGKTTVANRIIEALQVPWVTLLSMDCFYKVLNEEELVQAANNSYNFDHPDSFDIDLLVETLKKLKEGKNVQVPIYNFTTHGREKISKTMYGANVIIFEGIMAFARADLVELMDLKVFVDTDSDIRLARRLRRDIKERGRELQGVLKQYNSFVKPAFEQHIAPSMAYADIVVPRGAENLVALDLIVRHVRKQLNVRGFKLRSKLRSTQCGEKLPDSVCVLESTNQVRGLHTIIRNQATRRDEFIFYSKRLMRLLLEKVLTFLPFTDKDMQLGEGASYPGKEFNGKVCGVSILRAGETMEPALQSVCRNVELGKILIQTSEESGEPELHYYRLPDDVADSFVVLMDATLATGAAALMAIRVLLDHGVQQENLVFASLIAAEQGVHNVAYAFPKVQVVTTAVDKIVNEKFHIIPGIGNFGDRFFGTDSR
ncbi:uridine-cytidine kinase-like 1 [Sycon ciliatum]|uniref:uridine-cytidine kinase-like 1 n=1 Tax=Sycon ciliatum TaxID=27933 RepID=UPI0020A8F950|eukprot:scpid25431/ scgid10181/ Uridine-cytidine kinase-like 1